ncbi:MAG: hypothetical protein H7175_10020 [Burkholderiales bacterium]|nr:hypothetical protein [Anaerolineae bacterium]
MRIMTALLLLVVGCTPLAPSTSYFAGETHPVVAEANDISESAVVLNSAQSTYQAYLTARVYLFRNDTAVPLAYPNEPYTLGESTYGEPQGSTLGLHFAQFSQDEGYLTAFGITRDSDHTVYGIKAIVLVWETATGELLFAFHPAIDWVEAIDYDLAGSQLILEGCAAYGGLTYLYPRNCDGRELMTETYSLQTGEVVSEL